MIPADASGHSSQFLAVESPAASSPATSRMASPQPQPQPLPYGPRAAVASPSGYASSQQALLPPSGPMPSHPSVSLSRQSSTSSMNSGDGFFKNGRYAAAQGISRSSSPMYDAQPYGSAASSMRGRSTPVEKGGYPGTPTSMAPSMQDKVCRFPSSSPRRSQR